MTEIKVRIFRSCRNKANDFWYFGRDGTEKEWLPYIPIATNELKSLLIYTDKFKYIHTF